MDTPSRTGTHRGDSMEDRDQRQLILTRKKQQNEDAVEALRLQHIELDKQIASLLVGEEVSSSH